MKIRPMVGEYDIPGIERIGTIESRRVVEVPVPGLEGSYHQDLGSRPVAIRIEGTLAGDEARDVFLKEVRDKFKAGEPVDFVADITTATEINQVLMTDLSVKEMAGNADTFRYAMTFVQHVEPPAPAGPNLGVGDLAGLDAALDLEALGNITALMDGLDIGLAFATGIEKFVPQFGDLLSRLQGFNSAGNP